jgi:predicted membrane GTPase involved in stress response
MLVITLDYNDYVGRIGIGRVFNGKIRAGPAGRVLKRDGSRVNSKVGSSLQFRGSSASSGRGARGRPVRDRRAGVVDIGDTIADPEQSRRPAAGDGRRADDDDALPHQRLAVRAGRRASTSPAARSASA